jgi:hypothetical protein
MVDPIFNASESTHGYDVGGNVFTNPVFIASEQIQSYDVGGTLEVQNNEIGWVETSDTSITAEQDCINYDDVGNVRLVSSTCSWVTTSGFNSDTDVSTTATCQEGATRVICNYNETFDTWLCSNQEANVVEEYEKCEIL